MSVTRPVVLARGSGVTRNISTSGVFFETNADYVVGSKIIFAIELDGSFLHRIILGVKAIREQ